MTYNIHFDNIILDSLFKCDKCHIYFAEYNLDLSSGPHRECWYCWWSADEEDDFD